MGMPENKKGYTYSEYLEWDEGVFCEVIDGEIIGMSPAPSPRHQDVIDELTAEFKMYLRGKECMAFSAPIDVWLFAEKETRSEDIRDWVQPDLIVVCDESKIGEKNIVGAPDLVIEVLSPSTARNDRLVKFNSYEKAGVKEYWIVDPFNLSVEVYLLEDARFKQSGVFISSDKIKVNIFTDFSIDLKHIFKQT